jgi:hypothetical protein
LVLDYVNIATLPLMLGPEGAAEGAATELTELTDAFTEEEIFGPQVAEPLDLGPTYRVGETMPSGRVAGSGPGAAPANGGEFGKTTIQIRSPNRLDKPGLSEIDLARAQKAWKIKQKALTGAAERGELKFSPGTDSVRAEEAQEQYRADVTARFKRRFGVEPDLTKLNADHPIDLIVGGKSYQRLRMIDKYVNKSVGASLKEAGKTAGLSPGQQIDQILFIDRGEEGVVVDPGEAEAEE